MSETQSKRRVVELDAMKFFAIVFMITVHIFEFDFSPGDYGAAVNNAVFFLGGPAAAPAFMFCMGVTVMFSRRRGPADHIRRGFILLMMGYLLNALNGWIAMSIGYFMGYPTVSADDVIELVFIVDILHFAGMGFMLIGVLEKLKVSHLGMLLIALAMQALGYVLAGTCTGNPAVDGLLGLFVKMEFPESAFPLLNWFIFPVAGIVFSDILVRCSDHRALYSKILAVSAATFVLVTVICVSAGIDVRDFYMVDSYYNQDILKTIFSLSWVMTELSLLYFLMSRIRGIPTGDRVISAVTRVSYSLTAIYFIQWLIIGNISDVIYILDHSFKPWLFPVFVAVLVPLCMWMGVKVKSYGDSYKAARSERV